MVLLFFIIREWKKDCKKIGKENLAVSLKDRLLTYFGLYVLPILIVILLAIFK